MLNDENRLFNKNGKSFIVAHNLRGRSIPELVAQFQKNESFRKRKRKDSVIITHEIISFHKEDSTNISLKKLEEIAREYINKRNNKGLFVAVPHFDKEHYHIHICASGVEYRTGKSLRMTKAGFQKLKKDIQNYQVEHYPELSNSLVKHDKKSKVKYSEKEYQEKLRTKRATKKESLVEVIEDCLKTSGNQKEFFKKLQESGIEIYKRNGKVTGVVLDNMKFRFNRLGISPEQLSKLEISDNRSKSISEVRSRKGRNITLNR